MGNAAGGSSYSHLIRTFSWQVLCVLPESGMVGRGGTEAYVGRKRERGSSQATARTVKEGKEENRYGTAPVSSPVGAHPWAPARPHSPPKEPHLRDRDRACRYHLHQMGHPSTQTPTRDVGEQRGHSRAQAIPCACHALYLRVPCFASDGDGGRVMPRGGAREKEPHHRQTWAPGVTTKIPSQWKRNPQGCGRTLKQTKKKPYRSGAWSG